jgi:hypothetical protein
VGYLFHNGQKIIKIFIGPKNNIKLKQPKNYVISRWAIIANIQNGLPHQTLLCQHGRCGRHCHVILSDVADIATSAEPSICDGYKSS